MTNNFRTRTLTGILFVAIVAGCIWWNFWSMAVLFFVISALGLWEFYSLLEKNNYAPQKYYGLLLGAMAFITIGILRTTEHSVYLFFMIAAIFSAFIIELFREKGAPFINVALTLTGIIYIILPFSLLLAYAAIIYDAEIISSLFFGTEHSEQSKRLILGFFFLIWANDTFAYLIGKSMGKTRLFERISPKKTWEGTVGGAICSQGIAYIISIYFIELHPVHWHVVAMIVSVFGTFGDLTESMFKRSMGVKDSGIIFPGHGGILDRFDSALLAAPFVIIYLILIR